MHSICPYFAMFPERFVATYAEELTSPGEYVFDPFSGRGTTLFQSLLMGRPAAATDINPVAFCLTGAKANAPALILVLRELDKLEVRFRDLPPDTIRNERRALPPFFGRAFYWSTLEQLLFLRAALKWTTSSMHRFIAALALGSLHGERDKSMQYFSNQMPRTISTKPDYSLKYWRKHNLWPHKRDVFSILRNRARYRLAQGSPRLRGKVALADARRAFEVFPELHGVVRAVITSPPYFNVTNFEEDQWLRLWFLGHESRPTYNSISRDDRHTTKGRYWRFLQDAWVGVAPLLKESAMVVCRMGGKDMEEDEITSGLAGCIQGAFATAQLLHPPTMSPLRNRQTRSFRPDSRGCIHEWDYVFSVQPG